MAEYGEWNRKGASLSDVTAKKEYGVDREFIIKGINAGKLEFREGSIYGNPYIKVLRRQLEEYIADASEVPVILYNVPSRTAIDIAPENSISN